jgi:hypothetical protein
VPTKTIVLVYRYPTRVFLLMGNRDNNKQKLSAELDPYAFSCLCCFCLRVRSSLRSLLYICDMCHSEEIAHTPVTAIPGPYWVTEASIRVTPIQYLRSLLTVTEGHDEAAIARVNTRVNRLKYLLIHTMGADTTFENRRRELALIENRSLASITDEHVCQHFHDSVTQPDGFMRQYIELSQVWRLDLFTSSPVSVCAGCYVHFLPLVGRIVSSGDW